MVVSRWVVTDFGDVCPSGSQSVSDAIGVQTTERIEEYAVESMGFIGVSLRHVGWMIRYRPMSVTQPALAGLFQLLLDHPDSPVAIAWFDDDVWKLEHTANIKSAISFISYSLEKSNATGHFVGPRIQSRASSEIKKRWLDAKPLVLPAFQRFGVSAPFTAVIDGCFAGRWAIAEVSNSGRVNVIRRGLGYPPLDSDLSGKKQEYSLDGLADEEYKNWVKATFIEVARSGQAQCEEVDALIKWHRLGDIRTRYWRIVAPLDASDQSCRLLCASGNDSSIELRPEHIDKASQVYGGLSGGHPQQHKFT
jgi:hypothetical protein